MEFVVTSFNNLGHNTKWALGTFIYIVWIMNFYQKLRHYIKTYTFMKINLLKNLTRVAFVVGLLASVGAQGQWSGEYGTEKYGNEWLLGKYGQKWLKNEK